MRQTLERCLCFDLGLGDQQQQNHWALVNLVTRDFSACLHSSPLSQHECVGGGASHASTHAREWLIISISDQSTADCCLLARQCIIHLNHSVVCQLLLLLSYLQQPRWKSTSFVHVWGRLLRSIFAEHECVRLLVRSLFVLGTFLWRHYDVLMTDRCRRAGGHFWSTQNGTVASSSHAFGACWFRVTVFSPSFLSSQNRFTFSLFEFVLVGCFLVCWPVGTKPNSLGVISETVERGRTELTMAIAGTIVVQSLLEEMTADSSRGGGSSTTLSAAAAAEMFDSFDHVSMAETASIGSSSVMEGGDTTAEQVLLTDEQAASLSSCDACPNCPDLCGNAECQQCITKRNCCSSSCDDGAGGPVCPCPTSSREQQQPQSKYYTRCQVRRHNHESSCWLVAGDAIYDATPILETHPGGAKSLLRKAGGIEDCTIDLQFHSRSGRDKWKRYQIGTLKDCCSSITSNSSSQKPSNNNKNNKPWWAVWS